MEIIAELWAFMKTRKKIWLAPIILIALLLSLIFAVSSGSAVAPFIYALF